MQVNICACVNVVWHESDISNSHERTFMRYFTAHKAASAIHYPISRIRFVNVYKYIYMNSVCITSLNNMCAVGLIKKLLYFY